jgi:ADP-ribose pyrophosphatase YjhB (NUDIX family)
VPQVIENDRIKPDLAVNVVLFTLVETEKLSRSIWANSLISTGKLSGPTDTGTGLFVVTLRDTESDQEIRVLPGDLVTGNESLLEAAIRVVRDVLGVKANVKLRQIDIFDKADRTVGSRVISIPYWGAIAFDDLRLVLGGRYQVGLELVTSTEFIDTWEQQHNGLEDFDGVSRFGHRLAPNQKRGHERRTNFDMGKPAILGHDHDDMVFYGWRKLRHAFTGRLDPFRFLGMLPFGREFRISDLQNFRDVARGEKSQADQFRRSMLQSDMPLLRQTMKVDNTKRGKPARLYELNMDSSQLDFDSNEEL